MGDKLNLESMEEDKNPVGRPTKYDEKYHPAMAMKLCLTGLTDAQMAVFFEVHEDTIHEWKKVHPEFSESIKRGKTEADSNVASMLYKKAIGFTQKRKVAMKLKESVNGEGSKETVEIVEVEDYFPPEAAAQFFWLKNRQPEKWRDKREVDIKDERNLDTSKLSDSALDEIEKALSGESEGDQENEV